MPVPPPNSVTSRLAVLIPLRSLTKGKSRLAGTLNERERAELITSMAESVLLASGDVPTYVVFEDPDVASWTKAHGAHPIQQRRRGLNNAIDDACALLAEHGFDRVIICHADLPYATDLLPVAAFDGITIVPDRFGTGTNALCIPTDGSFRVSFGKASFVQHRATAHDLDAPLRILDDHALSWDVNTPIDLDGYDHEPQTDHAR